MWVESVEERLNALAHTRHLNGFLLECTIMCCFKLMYLLNTLIAHFTAHQLLPVSRRLPRRRAAGHFRTAALVEVLDWGQVVRTGRGDW